MGKKLEKEKKTTDSGILQIEKDMQEKSVKLAMTPDDIERCYTNQTKVRDVFRRF